MSSPRKKKKKTPAKRRRKTRVKRIPRGTGFKIALALFLLAGIVVGAGYLVHRYLPPSAPPPPAVERAQKPAPATKKIPPPERRATTQASKTPVAPPIYEIYPERDTAKRPTPPVRPAVGRPKVAIIIDDIGYDRGLARQFMAFGVPLTFSVLPESPFQRTLVNEIRQRGLELMLHQPMQPKEYPEVNPGPGALLSAMSADELIAQLESNLDRLPGVRGINNHMGSQLTTESTRMYQIFSVLKQRKLYFVDSRSTADTVGRPSARMFKVPFAERDIFLDHFQDAKFIRKQFRRLIKEARQNGQAVAIAHPHRLTVELFKEMLPELQKQVQLVPASEIVHPVS
jgi:polysaccharide deacetylase 2 family uncharacterized protein YibQ